MRWKLILAVTGVFLVWGTVNFIRTHGLLGLFTGVFIAASIIGLLYFAYTLVRGDPSE